MKAPRFKNWFGKLSSLNQPQRRQVLDALHPAAGLDQVVALIAQARAPGRCCPRCGVNAAIGMDLPTTCSVFAAALAAVHSTT